jgi:hypothetical protein
MNRPLMCNQLDSAKEGAKAAMKTRIEKARERGMEIDDE